LAVDLPGSASVDKLSKSVPPVFEPGRESPVSAIMAATNNGAWVWIRFSSLTKKNLT